VWCHRRITRRPIGISHLGLSNPITGQDRPRGFQEAEALRFQDSRHMTVVKVSPAAWKEYVKLLKIPLTPLGMEPATFWCCRTEMFDEVSENHFPDV
jgi:hypothetical protein